MSDTVAVALISSLATMLGSSSGFFVYLSRRSTTKDATTRLLMGMAYDKVTYFGMRYIERGWISKDEYEELITYFYKPYAELGGNGTAERIIRLVERLPLHAKSPPFSQMVQRTDIRQTDRTEGHHDKP